MSLRDARTTSSKITFAGSGVRRCVETVLVSRDMRSGTVSCRLNLLWANRIRKLKEFYGDIGVGGSPAATSDAVPFSESSCLKAFLIYG